MRAGGGRGAGVKLKLGTTSPGTHCWKAAFPGLPLLGRPAACGAPSRARCTPPVPVPPSAPGPVHAPPPPSNGCARAADERVGPAVTHQRQRTLVIHPLGSRDRTRVSLPSLKGVLADFRTEFLAPATARPRGTLCWLHPFSPPRPLGPTAQRRGDATPPAVGTETRPLGSSRRSPGGPAPQGGRAMRLSSARLGRAPTLDPGTRDCGPATTCGPPRGAQAALLLPRGRPPQTSPARARSYLRRRPPRARSGPGSGGRRQARAPRPGAPGEQHPAGAALRGSRRPGPRSWARRLLPAQGGRAGGCVPVPAPVSEHARRDALFSPPTEKERRKSARANRPPGRGFEGSAAARLRPRGRGVGLREAAAPRDGAGRSGTEGAARRPGAGCGRGGPVPCSLASAVPPDGHPRPTPAEVCCSLDGGPRELAGTSPP